MKNFERKCISLSKTAHKDRTDKCVDVKNNIENSEDSDINTIVLAGNPNVGKSVFFNGITGAYVEVSNFPGTTVDVSKGKWHGYTVIDTPGVYGVSSFNDEERVARDVILEGDIIINVVDAVHLHRDLFLTQQLIDMDKRMIVCLNMMDEVEISGLKIDTEKLREYLGVPIIESKALSGQGIDELKNSVHCASKGNKTENIDKYINELSHITDNIPELVMIMEDDPYTLEKYKLDETQLRDSVYAQRRTYVDKIVNDVVDESDIKKGFSAKLGELLLKPWFGVPAFLICLAFLFWFVGVVAAQYVVEITEGIIMEGYYRPFVEWLIGGIIPKETFFGQILIGEFGLLTMVPVYIFGLLLPLVAAFYLSLSVLEDSGYLPRIAVLVDKLFSKLGLNGRAIIPIILGFGCVTAATVSTRLLGTRREKVIATALLGITIPCSAQMGLIIAKIAPLGPFYITIYTVTIVLIFAIVGTVLNKMLSGTSTTLMIDLPHLRLPQIKNVLKKTYSKTYGFIVEAFGIFSIGALLISICDYTGILEKISRAAMPLVTGVLRLPKEAAVAFVMGLMRRDFGVAGLNNLPMTPNQVLVAMVTLTLFVPCIASVLTMFKERSKLEAICIWLFSFIIAFFVGGILAWGLALI